MARILGIDYGRARIGLALSDPKKIIASSLPTIKTKKTIEESVESLLKEVNLNEVEAIVIGLPLLLSGKESEMSLEVKKFAACLEEKSHLPVILWDERLTSKQVEKLLIEGGVKRKKRAQLADQMSALLILQSYLDRR